MAITINGSGTITGISAGGLPDNCVTAADLATTLDLSSNTVTLPSGTGGKILQVVQSVQDAVYSVSWSSNGDIVSMPTDFNVSLTPVSRSNYFLIECCWYVGVKAQTNVGFAIKENSSGSAVYIKKADGSTQWKNTDTSGSHWPSGNNDVMWSYGPGYSTGNDERQDITTTKFLTKLGTTSGSGSVTWSFSLWGGETSPCRFNVGGVSSTNSYSFPCVSTTTVTELAP